MLFPIQILHKLGSKDSIFPKAFENKNMHFFLEGGGGGVGGWSAKQSVSGFSTIALLLVVAVFYNKKILLFIM